MSLQELCSLVKSILLLLVNLLFLSDDLVEIFAPTLLFNTLSPLLLDLCKILHLVFELGLELVTLLILGAHVLIVRLERLRVLLVGTVELAEQSFLVPLILILHRVVLRGQLLDLRLQRGHRLGVALLTCLLDSLSLANQLRLLLHLLGLQLGARFFQGVDLQPSLLLRLLALFDVLVEIILLGLELVLKLLDALAGSFDLVLHASELLERSGQLGVPKLHHVLELNSEFVDLAFLLHFAELFDVLVSHGVAFEVVHELEDVRSDLVCVANGCAPCRWRFKQLTVEVRHRLVVLHVELLKLFLALGLRVQQIANLFTPCGD